MDTEGLVVDAFKQLGVEARLLVGVPTGDDLSIGLEGVDIELLVERRSLVNEDVAERLVTEAGGRVVLVVGDRVTEGARGFLTANDAGFLDLRGRLALRAGTVLIDAEIKPVKERVGRVDALSGKAGLEVAVALLLNPEESGSVRELAREIGRAPSTVSEVLKALRQSGLIDSSNRVLGTELFWAVADRWSTPQTFLAHLPDPADPGVETLRVGLEADVGWATVGSLPAARYGAPVVARADQLIEFYVPDRTTVRRAVTFLGFAPTASSAKASVRVAPVPAVLTGRKMPDGNGLEWPVARPLFVALDLAQDQGRGREILDAWTPTEGERVW